MHGWVIEEYLGYMEKRRGVFSSGRRTGSYGGTLYNEETGTVEVNLIKGEKSLPGVYLRGRWNWEEEKWSKRGEVVDRSTGGSGKNFLNSMNG